jgi:hypothetical protein
MRNSYFLLSFFLLTSCGTVVDYVGKSYSPSTHVDVFVTPSSVPQEYEIIGKGYVHNPSAWKSRLGETIQRKAIIKAKAKGADAIIIQDYILVTPVVQSGTVADSSKSNVTLGNMAVTQQGTTGFTVLFIKYKEAN